MSETTSPFVVGARVAVCNGRGVSSADWSEDTVTKVHKTGHIVLASQPSTRWRVSDDRGFPVGEAHRWGGLSMLAWTGANDAILTERVARTKMLNRWDRAVISAQRLERDRVTPALVDAVEAALGALDV